MALTVGDIAIVGFSSTADTTVTPNTKFLSFVLLADVPAGEVVKFTDNGWNGTAFRTGEGIVSWTAPASGLQAGQVVTLQIPTAAGTVAATQGSASLSGGFNLSGSGDQILVYQGSDATPAFLYALNNSGSAVWQATASSTNTSALPAGLGTASMALNQVNNYAYGGPLSGTKADLLATLGTQANWNSSASAPASLTVPAAFTVGSAGASLDYTGSINETAAFDDFRASGTRVVILRARPGAKVWSAGHDVSELPGRGRDPIEARIDPLQADAIAQVQVPRGRVGLGYLAGIDGGRIQHAGVVPAVIHGGIVDLAPLPCRAVQQ